jgi:hypothetical protein
MLPRNVVVQEVAAGKTAVAAIDPVMSMQAIDNPRLAQAAARVQAMLRGRGREPVARARISRGV